MGNDIDDLLDYDNLINEIDSLTENLDENNKLVTKEIISTIIICILILPILNKTKYISSKIKSIFISLIVLVLGIYLSIFNHYHLTNRRLINKFFFIGSISIILGLIGIIYFSFFYKDKEKMKNKN